MSPSWCYSSAMTETCTVRVDAETRDRLNALAQLTDQPLADIVRTLSHADLSLFLQATARRGAREVAEGQKGAARMARRAAEITAQAHEFKEKASLEAILDEIVEVLGRDFEPDELLKIAADPNHPNRHLGALVKGAADPAKQVRLWAQLAERRGEERDQNVQSRKETQHDG